MGRVGGAQQFQHLRLRKSKGGLALWFRVVVPQNSTENLFVCMLKEGPVGGGVGWGGGLQNGIIGVWDVLLLSSLAVPSCSHALPSGHPHDFHGNMLHTVILIRNAHNNREKWARNNNGRRKSIF